MGPVMMPIVETRLNTAQGPRDKRLMFTGGSAAQRPPDSAAPQSTIRLHSVAQGSVPVSDVS